MSNGNNGSYIGLLSFLSLGFSIIAAVLAIDMYRLLRTGEFGKTWRLLIITSVMFSLMQVLRMAEFLNWKAFSDIGLSEVVELVFVISLAYTFYLQRRVFTLATRLRENGNYLAPSADSEEANLKQAREKEWGRLGGYYSEYYEGEDTERLLQHSESLATEDDDIEWTPRSRPASPPLSSPLPPGTPKAQH